MSIDERHELPSPSASLRQEIERLTRVAVESTNKHRSIAEKAMLLRDTLVTLSDEDSFAEPIVALVNDALAQYDLLVHGDTEFSRTEARTLKAENQRLAARLREQQAENVLLRGELRASEDHSGITNVVEQMQVQLGKERDAREGAESSLTTLQGALKAKAEEWRVDVGDDGMNAGRKECANELDALRERAVPHRKDSTEERLDDEAVHGTATRRNPLCSCQRTGRPAVLLGLGASATGSEGQISVRLFVVAYSRADSVRVVSAGAGRGAASATCGRRTSSRHLRGRRAGAERVMATREEIKTPVGARRLKRAIDIAAGRLASGYVTTPVLETVRVTCHKCGGVTVFPVLLDADRPTPAPCLHCGAEI
jgi:hypothetical protein